MEGAECPAFREESSETFSILAFLSAGGAGDTGVSPFCNGCDIRQFKSYLLQSDTHTMIQQTKIYITFTSGGAKLAGPADEAMTLST